MLTQFSHFYNSPIIYTLISSKTWKYNYNSMGYISKTQRNAIFTMCNIEIKIYIPYNTSVDFVFYFNFNTYTP